MKKENIGSSLDDLLREDGIYEQVNAAAIKRVLERRGKSPLEKKSMCRCGNTR